MVWGQIVRNYLKQYEQKSAIIASPLMSRKTVAKAHASFTNAIVVAGSLSVAKTS